MTNEGYQSGSRLANSCCEALADIILEMNERDIVMAVENPRSSIFWSTSAWSRVAHLFVYTTFQHCAYQGDRPKWTRVAYNHSSFSALCLTCPGEWCVKRHRPWGRTASGTFATAEETAYPPGLARAIAQSFRMAIPVEPVQPLLPLAEMRATAGSQPKASKVMPLVPEFKKVVVVKSPKPCPPPAPPPQKLTQAWRAPPGCQCAVPLIPAGSKVLKVLARGE